MLEQIKHSHFHLCTNVLSVKKDINPNTTLKLDVLVELQIN